jgi:hypothetical protein
LKAVRVQYNAEQNTYVHRRTYWSATASPEDARFTGVILSWRVPGDTRQNKIARWRESCSGNLDPELLNAFVRVAGTDVE